jgi:hypothetical protein
MVQRDTTAPNTTIRGRSMVRSNRRRVPVSFRLISTEAGSRFKCRLDGASFQPCSSPFKARVRRGRHVLRVRALDGAGNRDLSPAAFPFRVKRKRRS